MQINLNQISSTQVELDKSAKSKAGQQASSASTNVEDRASLKNDSASVSSLQTMALAVPDVRQNKVDALKQQIQSGEYKDDPDDTAKAMRENGL